MSISLTLRSVIDGDGGGLLAPEWHAAATADIAMTTRTRPTRCVMPEA